jgi:hypothetical protein
MGDMGRVQALSVGLVVGLVAVTTAGAATWTMLRSNGVAVRVPAPGWVLVTPADAGAVADPRTVLVAGTDGVVARRSQCQVAAYRIPADGAAVVVLRWAGKAPEWLSGDRSELESLRLRRAYFECWEGRGAAAVVAIRGRAYQVNVMVGDRASSKTITSALEAAASLDAR